MEFADRLREAMRKENLSQKELVTRCNYHSDEVGVRLDAASLSRYLKGVEQPKQKRITLLAKALNVDELWLKGLEMSEDILKIRNYYAFTTEPKENG